MITVNKITGFQSTSPLVLISKGGNTFYYFENVDCKPITFNLPIGEYDVFCDITPLKNPLRYIIPTLPKREKYVPVWDIEIREGNNPNKCSIDIQSGAIFIDSSFNKNECEKVFILGHELGHFYYFTEWKCDLFSAKAMLENGYNPSQCYYSNSFCLSDNQNERKDILFRWLKKIKCYE